MSNNPYERLARRLDALPNGFPPTEDGAELQLLAKLFTAEEAALAAELRLTKETSNEIANRLGAELRVVRSEHRVRQTLLLPANLLIAEEVLKHVAAGHRQVSDQFHDLEGPLPFPFGASGGCGLIHRQQLLELRRTVAQAATRRRNSG